MNKLQRFITLFIAIVACFVSATYAQRRADYNKYIESYKDLALKCEKKYGVPASITLAQALLESDAGKSRLAVNANNHFGIKAFHWVGEVYFLGDSTVENAYRKYPSVDMGYDDHAKFLKGRRYKKLFSLDKNDYVGWANGIRECGYAEDTIYAVKLIRIINLYELYKLSDEKAKPITDAPKVTTPAKSTTPANTATASTAAGAKPVGKREVKSKWGIYYAMAQSGDTYASVAKEFSMSAKKLINYNDERNINVAIRPGTIIYLSPKLTK
ncbi:MAG: glucosaminidase domain-containing protein, partial [Muribaculaceae bacterium]|nr:glucosaminidase domain-containing protein [Muribaculaceae bacterium]